MYNTMKFLHLFALVFVGVNAFRLPAYQRNMNALNLQAAFTAVDSSDVIAAGTPFERPKIGNSVLDLIGGTPMVC